jgi:hypothetical protein
MLYREGYCCVRGLSPSQRSSQNRVSRPFPILKEPIEKKTSFTFIRPFQKGESVVLTWTWDRVLECKYLLCSNSCHITFSFKSFNNHFLSKHLFLISKTSTPSPPWSLGRHMMSYLVSLYFLLCPSLCQKNLDLKKASLLHTPIGISRKDNMNMGKLVRTVR